MQRLRFGHRSTDSSTERSDIMKVASMLVGIAFALTMTPVAFAQTGGDAGYCSALANKYNTYVETRGSRGARQGVSADIATAMSQCQTSNATSAIPVLERALRDAKIDLPSRS